MNEYVNHPVYGYRVMIPWKDEYDEVYERIKDRTFLTKERLYYLLSLSDHAIRIDGDFAECGVYKGGSAFSLAHQIAVRGARKRLHLFDTFSGVPALTTCEFDSHKPGDFSDVSFDEVSELFDGLNFVKIHKGRVDASLQNVQDDIFSFVHLDLDNYIPTHTALDFFYVRMPKGGIMLFDDYGFPTYEKSVKRAVDEFLKGREESPIALSSGQSFIIKL